VQVPQLGVNESLQFADAAHLPEEEPHDLVFTDLERKTPPISGVALFVVTG
jgi:hypothetical protein